MSTTIEAKIETIISGLGIATDALRRCYGNRGINASGVDLNEPWLRDLHFPRMGRTCWGTSGLYEKTLNSFFRIRTCTVSCLSGLAAIILSALSLSFEHSKDGKTDNDY